MARLDAEMLDQILTTLRDYAEANLPTARLLEIELGHEFPEKVMKDLYDPGQIGLHGEALCAQVRGRPDAREHQQLR